MIFSAISYVICLFQGVSDMGPAVFNGGFSTFLAFALLMTSKSFVFVTFFKIFFLVVGFGLYHGLVFLPVVLRYIIQNILTYLYENRSAF